MVADPSAPPGAGLVKIDTSRPWGIETKDGIAGLTTSNGRSAVTRRQFGRNTESGIAFMRSKLAPREPPLIWVSSTKNDLLAMPTAESAVRSGRGHKVNRDRRRFVTTTATLAAVQLAGVGLAEAQSRRNGRAPVTGATIDSLAAQRKTGRFTCVRTPESNDGPYYYRSSPQRRAIAEGRSGVPLKLRIIVAGALRPGDSCPPLSNAVVDIWHADADGMYSNVGADLQTVNTVGQTFMRGHQVTDATGQVEFDSVMPGWEIGRNVVRATHVHVKVFHENKIVTAQLYFPNEYLDELYANVDPYRTHRQMTAPGTDKLVNRLRNEEDVVFLADHSTPMPIRREANVVIAEAMIGISTLGSLGVDPLFK
jgi:protocatechuate 3,4-dioxygenase beta subunit